MNTFSPFSPHLIIAHVDSFIHTTHCWWKRSLKTARTLDYKTKSFYYCFSNTYVVPKNGIPFGSHVFDTIWLWTKRNNWQQTKNREESYHFFIHHCANSVFLLLPLSALHITLRENHNESEGGGSFVRWKKRRKIVSGQEVV